MITFLQGTLEESWPGRLVINAGGVGYEVTVAVLGDDVFGKIGAQTKVLTHHHIPGWALKWPCRSSAG